MISITRTEPKSFETRLSEAYEKIPLYSKEWTNFNPSDPGVTILENLTAFNTIQSNQLGVATDATREKLLKLMGFTPVPGRCSRTLLEAKNIEEDLYLPAGQKFKVGNTNFETNRKSIAYANKVVSVLSKSGDDVRDCSALLDDKSSLTVKVFGDEPKVNDELYLFFERMPHQGTDVIFYFDFDNRFNRTGGDEKSGNAFAEIEWQYKTTDGFETIKVKDYTRAFLTGGEIRFSIPEKDGAEEKLSGTTGYCIKAVLKRADYDIPPRFSSIHGFLFEVWQKETKSICHTMARADQIEIYCDLLEEDYVSVFCKEGRNDEFYHKYSAEFDKNEKGRFYGFEHKAFGLFSYSFNKKKHGFGPNSAKDAVKIVAYSEQMMKQYQLGMVYGYDNQEINIPARNIVWESFSIIAERTLDDGEKIYNFVKPGRVKEGSLYYTLDEREGKVIIVDAGEYIGANLYMCSCAVTLGEDGNVRKGNVFTPIGYENDIVFTNPCEGAGGNYREALADVERRFVKDIEQSYTAVKESDYEEIVKKIPDLCIKKVHAIADYDKNKVSITCMPYSDKDYPTLPPIYLKKIEEYLEERRVLTTEIEVVQPQYAPIDVHGVIYVKKHYEKCREEIEKVLNKYLDYTKGNQQFGALLKFEDMFREIEELECVEYIFELSIRPENPRYAKVVGMDVKPSENVLCVPGRFYFEVNTSNG